MKKGLLLCCFDKTGSAEVQMDPDKTKVEMKDSNTADNTCGSK